MILSQPQHSIFHEKCKNRDFLRKKCLLKLAIYRGNKPVDPILKYAQMKGHMIGFPKPLSVTPSTVRKKWPLRGWATLSLSMVLPAGDTVISRLRGDWKHQLTHTLRHLVFSYKKDKDLHVANDIVRNDRNHKKSDDWILLPTTQNWCSTWLRQAFAKNVHQ